MRREEPVIPLYTQFHDTKAKEGHSFHFHKAKLALHKYAPQIKDMHIVVISDREFPEAGVVEMLGPNVNLSYCWNHLLTNFKRQAQHNLKMDARDVKESMAALHRLLRQDSEEDYIKTRDTLFNPSDDAEQTVRHAYLHHSN